MVAVKDPLDERPARTAGSKELEAMVRLGVNRDGHGGPGSNDRSRIAGLADRRGRRKARFLGSGVAAIARAIVSRPVDLSTVRRAARGGHGLAGPEGVVGERRGS